jgi:hypothetical protein
MAGMAAQPSAGLERRLRRRLVTSSRRSVVVGLGGPGTFPSTVAPGGSFTSIHFAVPAPALTTHSPPPGRSAASDDGATTRTARSSLAPKKVWLATHNIPNHGDGNANWGDRIFELTTP